MAQLRASSTDAGQLVGGSWTGDRVVQQVSSSLTEVREKRKPWRYRVDPLIRACAVYGPYSLGWSVIECLYRLSSDTSVQ